MDISARPSRILKLFRPAKGFWAQNVAKFGKFEFSWISRRDELDSQNCFGPAYTVVPRSVFPTFLHFSCPNLQWWTRFDFNEEPVSEFWLAQLVALPAQPTEHHNMRAPLPKACTNLKRLITTTPTSSESQLCSLPSLALTQAT